MNTEIYRVYDTENNEWITDECVIAPDNKLYKITNKRFGNIKLEQICSLSYLSGEKTDTKHKNNARYIIQRSIDLFDRSRKMIIEGDILRDRTGLIGVVYYSKETASYILIVTKSNLYYPLGDDICNKFKIIGNIIDDEEIVNM